MIADRTRSAVVTVAGLGLLAGSAEAQERPLPVDHSGRPQSGVASFYSRKEAGKTTAASRTLPLGAKAQVVNKENGRAVTVTINDRGPYVGGRVVDVTPEAAEKLGMTHDGVARVEVEPLAGPSAQPH